MTAYCFTGIWLIALPIEIPKKSIMGVILQRRSVASDHGVSGFKLNNARRVKTYSRYIVHAKPKIFNNTKYFFYFLFLLVLDPLLLIALPHPQAYPVVPP